MKLSRHRNLNGKRLRVVGTVITDRLDTTGYRPVERKHRSDFSQAAGLPPFKGRRRKVMFRCLGKPTPVPVEREME